MNSLRSYFAPEEKKENTKDGKKGRTKKSAEPGMERRNSPSQSSNSGPDTATIVPSRPTSFYPEGDFRNAPRDSLLDTKSDVMANWLHQRQLENLWAYSLQGEGVVLKKARGSYTCAPRELCEEDGGFFDQIAAMNVKCAMTVNTRVIQIFLSRVDIEYVPLLDGLRLQVIPSMAHLPRCQKHHFAAFVQASRMLVVWDDQPKLLLERAERIEKLLMQMIWSGESAFGDADDMDEKKGAANIGTSEVSGDGAGSEDLEYGLTMQNRPIELWNSVLCAANLALLISAMGSGWRKLAQQTTVDGSYLRLTILAAFPAQFFVSLFFFQTIVTNVSQILGPIGQVTKNTKHYSGKAPKRLNCILQELPHMTIQMPVYREGLTAVIQPTILSLKAAISTYEMQGGTANIFVNDDGMQLISDADAEARREFYEEHNVGWVSRPGHNPNPADGETSFLRRGKFKKASNMNYALMISNKVEDLLLMVDRDTQWTQEDEARAYGECLSAVLDAEEGRAWADGNIRIGDYILLIDSDTRVPVDCLLDAASEMEQCPNVAILQYTSGVMNVTSTFFENGVTFFTNLIYTAIKYGVANGDVSPFVGHNAVLRWSALQEVSFEDSDGYEKFWSESHVSEDFDMALRLQIAGYVVRFGAYTGEGFKEGVSLTVYDELNRWEKYAYGCNELIFHPLKYWLTRGPITPLFRRFLKSNMPLPSKITILAYVGTYYAIGAAWMLTVLNYFIVGWYNPMLDKYYLDSFAVYFSLVIVFTALGNVALAVFRYRMGEKSLLAALLENFKWILLLSVFLGGISLHISQALLSHFFSIDMSWGATAKEVENTTFFKEMPKLLRRFKGTFLFVIAGTATMIVCAYALPPFWRITNFQPIFPLAILVVSHFSLPVALNPALMMFTW